MEAAEVVAALEAVEEAASAAGVLDQAVAADLVGVAGLGQVEVATSVEAVPGHRSAVPLPLVGLQHQRRVPRVPVQVVVHDRILVAAETSPVGIARGYSPELAPTSVQVRSARVLRNCPAHVPAQVLVQVRGSARGKVLVVREEHDLLSCQVTDRGRALRIVPVLVKGA